MKKNYVYLLVLVVCTVLVTLLLSGLYRKEVLNTSYAYEKLNKITATEFNEYILENPDTIIYISDKTNLDNNKFEKKFISRLEKLNLLENVVYIDKEEVISSLKKILEEKYTYVYDENDLPTIIVISDGEAIQKSIVGKDSKVDTIIDYEVFE